ncbi:MAG: hypothetical protein KY446_10415 [Proteobacteria bacterium]|nr:hypothetical protein [Pseudomonadota bacterium]MBW3618139.1 hypothetical protein [Pseudomonadota bacterium]
MRDPLKTGFDERIKSQAEAKKALLAKFKPKPTVVVKTPEELRAEREAEKEAIRAKHAAEKLERARIAAAKAEAARQAELEAIRSAAEARKGAIKERKAMTKAEQKARKEARMAAYATLRPSRGAETEY